MAQSIPIAARPPAPSHGLRALALPVEHGGWGLLAEPLALGLLVAPCRAGVAIGIAVTGAFLWRHPARLAASDLRRGVRHARTRAALLIAALYGAAALGGAGLALAWTEASLFGLIGVVAPLAAVYLAYDARLRSRALAAEVMGALALGASAAAVARGAGWPMAPALGLWLLIAGRSIPSVLDVRARLRRARGVATRSTPVLATAAGFAAATVAALRAGILPPAASVVTLLLLVRIALHQRPAAAPVRARDVGWGEVRAGIAAIVAWAVAYRLFA
jgi:hypothetical protein